MRRTIALVPLLLLATACSSDPPTAAPPVSVPVTIPAPSPSATVPEPEPTTEAPTEPAAPKLGKTQTTDLGTATVYAVKFPVKAQDSTATDIRDAGMQFAIADIKVCANGSTNADGYGFDASDFLLVDSDARTYEFWNVQLGARSPNLTETVGFGLDTPRKGSCKRGWLTFQLPPKTKIVSVEYSSDGAPLVWQVR